MDFGFSFDVPNSGPRYWSVHIDETEVQWTCGGSVRGPYGTDSFTSCQYSLLCVGEDDPIGSPQLWLDYYRYFGHGISIRVEDDCEEDFWKEYERARPWRPADAEDDDE